MEKCNCDLTKVPPRHDLYCKDKYCLCEVKNRKHYHPYSFVFPSDKYIKNNLSSLVKE